MKHLNWRIFWKQLRILSTHYGMDVLLEIYCIFSEKHFLRTPLEGCFSLYLVQTSCIPLDRPNYWRLIYKNGSQGSLQNKTCSLFAFMWMLFTKMSSVTVIFPQYSHLLIYLLWGKIYSQNSCLLGLFQFAKYLWVLLWESIFFGQFSWLVDFHISEI